MPYPILTIARGEQKIIVRPRRQALYDTEGDNNGVAIVQSMTCYRNYTAFSTSGLSLTKIYGRDTNLDSQAGSLPKGTVFHWKSITLPVSARTADLTTIANSVVFEEIRRIRSARWATFRFGQSPYWTEPCDEIPQGVGASKVMTTITNVLVFDIANGRLTRENRRDTTLNGFPVEITPNESFFLDLVGHSALLPTPTVELYWSPHLHGTLMTGVQ